MDKIDSNTQAKLGRAIQETLAVEDLMDDIIEHISLMLSPSQVFEEEVLKEWAENNGYKLADD